MDKNTVKATKGNNKKEFSLEVWNQMPKGKYGWKTAAEIPDEVVNKKNQKASGKTEE